MAMINVKREKYRSIEEILRDPKAKATLTNMIDEAVQAKQQIGIQQEIIKGLRTHAVEDLGINPKLFNNYVACIFNNDYQSRREGLEQHLTLVELLMGEAQGQIEPPR